MKTILLQLLLVVLAFYSKGQNETQKWYFGDRAGLDFSTNPPTVLSNSAMHARAGCSSMSDATGNLLFYTNGDTIWNRMHQVMANGTGLFGTGDESQNSLIVKQPGNANLYYIFTVEG